MTVSKLVKKTAGAVLVMACGVLAGTAARHVSGDASVTRRAREGWATSARLHSVAAYDHATGRVTGRLGSRALVAVRDLSFRSTVLVALRGADVATCEDLGRQLRELRRAVPREAGWGMAILIDPAGQTKLRQFLAREHIPAVPVIIADPSRLLAGETRLATPAALIVDRDGRIQAGVSHPSRFKNARSRSFAQELPLH